MTSWKIQTEASTRSKSRRSMTHTISLGQQYRDVTVESEDDAVYVARMLHIERCGWNTSIWIKGVAGEV